MKAKKISGVLSGVAGEYLVAGELSRLGYIASITLRNTRGIDILVSNGDATKTVGIQVKTNQGTLNSWVLTAKAEKYFADNLFYVFVNLNHGKEVTYHIVPSKIVATKVKNEHKEWLRTPGRGGQKHTDNTIRKFADAKKEYLNRWELLGLEKKVDPC